MPYFLPYVMCIINPYRLNNRRIVTFPPRVPPFHHILKMARAGFALVTFTSRTRHFLPTPKSGIRIHPMDIYDVLMIGSEFPSV